MKKTLIVSTLALAVVGVAAVAGHAQNTAGANDRPAVQKADWRGHHGWQDRGERHGRRGDRDGWRGGHGGAFFERLKEFDADKDGAVTQAEVDQFRQGQIARFDTDKDGTLSLQEYQGLWLERMRERMVDAFADLVQRLDRNGDSKLDPADRGRRQMMQAPQEDGDEPAPAPQP
jgi:hypothetical protein